MFQQNANKWFFVCVTNSRNIVPLFHKKVISHDPLQKLYQIWPERVKINFMRIKKS